MARHTRLIGIRIHRRLFFLSAIAALAGCDRYEQKTSAWLERWTRPWIAAVDHQRIYLDEFHSQLRRLPIPYQQEVWSSIDKRRTFRDSVIRRKAETRLAEKMGIDQDMDVKDHLEAYRERLLLSTLAEKLRHGELNVSDEEIRKYYQDHPQEFTQLMGWKVRRISTRSRKDAETLHQWLKADNSIDTLRMKARRTPMAPWTISKNELIPADHASPELTQLLSRLSVGSVSDLRRDPSGIFEFFLKIGDDLKLKSFESVHSEIGNKLYVSRYAEWLKKHMDAMKIEINEGALSNLTAPPISK